MISRPVWVEPVKATLSTSGWETSRVPTSSPLPGTTFSTPAGSPHSSAIRANSSSVSGVLESGFITMLQPAARAGIGRHRSML